MEALIILVGIFVIALITLVYSSLSWGYVLYKFWGWFLLPVFTDLPTINYMQSVGLMFIVGLFCRYYGEGLKSEYKDNSTHFISLSILPWLTLFFGLFMHVFFINN